MATLTADDIKRAVKEALDDHQTCHAFPLEEDRVAIREWVAFWKEMKASARGLAVKACGVILCLTILVGSGIGVAVWKITAFVQEEAREAAHRSK